MRFCFAHVRSHECQMIRTQTVRCQLMLSIKFASGADLASRQGCRRSAEGGKGGGVRGAPLSWLIKINAPWNCESIAGRRPQPAPVFWPKTNAISKRYQSQHAAEQLARRGARCKGCMLPTGNSQSQSELLSC